MRFRNAPDFSVGEFPTVNICEIEESPVCVECSEEILNGERAWYCYGKFFHEGCFRDEHPKKFYPHEDIYCKISIEAR